MLVRRIVATVTIIVAIIIIASIHAHSNVFSLVEVKDSLGFRLMNYSIKSDSVCTSEKLMFFIEYDSSKKAIVLVSAFNLPQISGDTGNLFYGFVYPECKAVLEIVDFYDKEYEILHRNRPCILSLLINSNKTNDLNNYYDEETGFIHLLINEINNVLINRKYLIKIDEMKVDGLQEIVIEKTVYMDNYDDKYFEAMKNILNSISIRNK